MLDELDTIFHLDFIIIVIEKNIFDSNTNLFIATNPLQKGLKQTKSDCQTHFPK